VLLHYGHIDTVLRGAGMCFVMMRGFDGIEGGLFIFLWGGRFWHPHLDQTFDVNEGLTLCSSLLSPFPSTLCTFVPLPQQPNLGFLNDHQAPIEDARFSVRIHENGGETGGGGACEVEPTCNNYQT
jgi:hypothetical protein